RRVGALGPGLGQRGLLPVVHAAVARHDLGHARRLQVRRHISGAARRHRLPHAAVVCL
ncbi:hypothetical protein HK405_005628, partial [Cladochytrium tenue]